MDARSSRIAAVAGFGYFAIVFVAGFLLGALRVLLLIPKFGEVHSVLIELPIILLISWFACRWILAKFQVGPRLDDRIVMGGTAFAALMVAEIGVSVFGFGRSIIDHFAAYSSLPAQLGLAGQIAFGLFPALQRR